MLSIDLVLATVAMNLKCAPLTKEEQLQFMSLRAYVLDRLETIKHTNCNQEEHDIMMRRLLKRANRTLQDLVDGDYGHC